VQIVGPAPRELIEFRDSDFGFLPAFTVTNT
jgi:hypothetical protein